MKWMLIMVCNIVCWTTIGANQMIETSLMTHAKKMADCNNNKDHVGLVDYHLPYYYGNIEEGKKMYTETWKTLLEKDHDPITFLRIEKIIPVGNEYQALTIFSCRGKEWYVFAMSDNNGKEWKFTQLSSIPSNFNSFKRKIPTLDETFAAIIDPRHGTRIAYKEGSPAPSFTYTDIDGTTWSSDALRGTVIVLNFWSPTCGPCVKEIPELNAMMESLNDKKVVFIAPAAYTSKKRLLETFLPKNPFNYSMVIINADDYDIFGYPTHIIIGKDGIVQKVTRGYHSKSIQILKKQIEEAIAQP